MAGQLVPLEEAAKLLKVTPAELNEMRLRSEIGGVRTGSAWKFKMDEIERVADERGIQLGGTGGESDASPAEDPELELATDEPLLEWDALDDEKSSEEASSSILVSEQELGGSQGPSSTIIGENEGEGSAESDLVLASSGDEPSAGEGSNLRLDGPSAGESDLRLADDTGHTAAAGPQAQAQAKAPESDLRLAEESGVASAKPQAGSDLELAAESDAPRTSAAASDLTLADEGSGAAGGLASTGDSDIDLGAEVMPGAGESDLLLAGAEDLGPGDTGRLDEQAKSSNLEFATDDMDIDVSASSSALDLGDDDDLVLDSESALDGDVGLAGDSGINLTRPSDSGIDLAVADESGISISSAGESGFMLEDEDALELEGGSSADSLELPEDVDVVALDEELADPDAATQLKSEDDFDLTPVEGAFEDESDSGSQVIALDTEELGPEAASGLGAVEIAEEPVTMEPVESVITEEPLEGGLEAGPVAAQAGIAPGAQVQQTQLPVQELPEAPYTIWQVGSLAVVALTLLFSGILMIDVVRNIWAFNQPYGASTSIMNSIISALGI